MIHAHQRPAYRSYDGWFGYTDALGRRGRCYLQVFEARGSLPLAIACEVPDNPGPSITNAAEDLATQVWQQLLPHAREGIRFVECYVDPPHADRAGDAGGAPAARFDEVLFRLDHDRLHSPRWRHLSRAEVEAWIGGPFSVPIASSYRREAR